MHKFMSLVKRNCLVYLRDRSAVFFSMISMLVVLMLMGVFLGHMNINAVTELLNQYGGVRDTILDKENAVHLVEYWTLAGILVVNAINVTLAVIGVMVNDSSENRLQSFYTSPASKNMISISYIVTAIIMGEIFCFITLIAGLAYIYVTGGVLLSITAILPIMLVSLVTSGIFAIIMYLMAIFAKTNGAWSSIGLIVGTLVGFLGAIYLPMGELPAKVGDVLKYMPILHAASLMRKIFCKDYLDLIFGDMPEELVTTYQEHMGINVVMGENIVSSNFQILFMIICGMIALLGVVLIVRKKNVNDR